LAELLIDITALRRAYCPSPRRKVREQERSIVVGGRIAGRLAASTLLGRERPARLYLRSPHRRAGCRVDDAAADGRSPGAQLGAPTSASPLAAILRVGRTSPLAAGANRTATAAATAAAPGVRAALTAGLVRPALALAKQRRICDCHGDNQKQGETDDETHALLT
jgi:hypothetical protein